MNVTSVDNLNVLDPLPVVMKTGLHENHPITSMAVLQPHFTTSGNVEVILGTQERTVLVVDVQGLPLNVLRAARAPSYAQCVELLLRLVRRSSMPYLIAPRSAARHVVQIDEVCEMCGAAESTCSRNETLHPRDDVLLGVGPLLGPRGPRLPQERDARGRGRFP